MAQAPVDKADVTRNWHPIMLAKSIISHTFLSFSITPRNEILVPENDRLGSILQVSKSKILKKLLLVEKRPK